MKHFCLLYALTFALFIISCNSDADSIRHTPGPSVSTVPSMTPVPSVSTVPSMTPVPSVSTVPSPNSVNDLTDKLAATCDVDTASKVTCQAHRTSMKSKLSWTYMDKHWNGGTFQFSPYDPLPAEILVTLEECIGESCAIVEILLSTAFWVKDAIPLTQKVGSSLTSHVSGKSRLYPVLDANCSIDSQWTVSCESQRTLDHSTLQWTYLDRTSGSSTFEFALYEPIIRGPIVLKECIGDSCTEVTTTLDISHLDPSSLANRMTMQSTYSQGNCDPNGSDSLGSPPMNIAEIVYILPMGHMQGQHITPIDHLYVNYPPNKAHNIYSMADGHIVKVSDHGLDHRIVIEYSCDLYSIYIHITELSETIESQLKWKFPTPHSKGESLSRIPVKEGQVIGRASGNDSFDLSVVDTRVTLPGFVNLNSYAGEFWKFHTVDPFDYWEEPFKQALLDKTFYIDKDNPGGKIDLDVDGKLIGNWFQEGTGGYSGLSTEDDQYGVSGHLAFARSILVPDTLWVSFGSFGDSGRSQGFGVDGNGPDPATIGIESGQVKFLLRHLDHGPGPNVESGYKILSTGKWWDDKSFPENRRLVAVYRDEPAGVLLVEMLEARTIKIEVFESKASDEVSGFTDNAEIYIR